ncbi:MAG: hypothetical protein WCE94_14735 [Candidatus Methanoperedens sp.]
MKIINLISITLLVFILFFSGCIENKPISKTEINTPTPIPKQYIDKDFSEFYNSMTSDKLTLLQKQDLFNSYIGKYVKWRGEVIDVSQNSIQLRGNIGSIFSSNDIDLFVAEDQKSELVSLNKGTIITFEGMITVESIYEGNPKYYNAFHFKLFNGKIISKG